MKIRNVIHIFLTGLLIFQKPNSVLAQASVKETIIQEKLLYHPIH